MYKPSSSRLTQDEVPVTIRHNMRCTRSEMSENARISNAASDSDGLCRRTAAEPAHPTDRFAREILAISAPSAAARLRRLMRNMSVNVPLESCSQT